MNKIYLTSDLHFAHAKDFIFKPRGFHTVGEMNYHIISVWNNMVKDDDNIYVLGDMMLSDDKEGMWLLNNLRGHIHIVRGNHDSDRRIELYKKSPHIVEVENSLYLHYNGYHFYLTHYPTLTSNFDFDKPLKARLINLCGHSHIQNPFEDWDKYNAPIYHCELDAHNCTPISLDQIIQDIQNHLKN